MLALYFVLTLSYSLRLKDMVILDVLALAGLHALRVAAGSAAVGIPPSAWLIAFCGFLFFSLAMIKRYAELVLMRTIDGLAPTPARPSSRTASCSRRWAAPAAISRFWCWRSTSVAMRPSMASPGTI